MTDPRNAIQQMFDEPNRHASFGNVLMRMHVKGFRCHTDTSIEVGSPITAFSGLNGTGKSTLLQLAATSFGTSNVQWPPYYIKDFIVVGTLDPAPFKQDATVEYKFWDEDRSLRTLTLSRKDVTRRWQGYTHRPQRLVFFAGVGLYLPKIETRDFIVRNASHLQILNYEPATKEVREWTCKILGNNYQDVCSHKVKYAGQTDEVGTVQRSGVRYSEAHMGYGEGRTLHLISMLEGFPNQSLVLIEEPETSLHPSAQHEFGSYLVDVVKRKRHQVMLTTHSEFMLEALPSKSRIYLSKTEYGISPIPGLTAMQAKSLMSGGHVKALNILVEDKVAEAVLREIVRRVDVEFLRSVGIYVGGDETTIALVVRTLKPTGIPVAAVRDGDMPPAPGDDIFKLPGSMPPEKELFACASVKEMCQETYGTNLDDFVATMANVDHHQWFERLAARVNQEESALVMDASRVYARSLPENEATTLVTLLKETTRR